MPFIAPNNRDRIRIQGIESCDSVGDITYVFYCHIMQVWNEERRWRTAHRLYKNLEEQPEAYDYFNYVYEKLKSKFELDDVVCAAKLAYKVFFSFVVVPYEERTAASNGNIL